MSLEHEPAAAPDPDLADALALKAGDHQALERIMARHQAALLRVVQRSLNNPAKAQDLVQEVFVRAYFAIAQFSGRGSFKAWLYRIALNLVRDTLKGRAHRDARLTDSLSEPVADAAGDHNLRTPPALVAHRDPRTDAETREALSALRQAIARLPEDLRAAFILAALEELPHREIATILGISAKAVEMRVYKARKRLEKNMAQVIPR